MNKNPGYIKSLKKQDSQAKKYDHFVEIEWEFIPMLSVITGVNGIGKSSLMKMMVYFFNNNKHENLNYKFELLNGISRDELFLSLLHFDNNVMDLREHNFTTYNKTVKHLEINFCEDLKSIDLNWIRATSISRIFNTSDEEKLIQKLKNRFKTKFESFEILKQHQYKTAIHWEDCFPFISDDKDCFEFLTEISCFNNNLPKAIKRIGSMNNILLQNISNLYQINEMIKESDFDHLIYIIINSKIFFHDIHKSSNLIEECSRELDYEQKYILMEFLKNYVGENAEKGLKKIEFQTKSAEDLIKLLLCRRKAELDDLNKSLKEKKFKHEIFLETFLDLRFTTDKKMNKINQNKKLTIDTLSNGEQIKFLRVLWQFLLKNKQNTQFEKNQLLILDEPDSHMHPSSANKLVETIKQIVKDFGVQVILTTHNPNTVSFFDELNLFLFYENSSGVLQLRNGVSKNEIIRRLTSQLVLVNSPSRRLNVEGYDAFY